MSVYGPIEVPGTCVRAYVASTVSDPDWWTYTLWSDEQSDPIASDTINLAGLNATPEQVARIAFILHEHDEQGH
jgi:hypothetical protein